MDPRDVNRINYNNYYAGQNLDFLIRSKMRSESLSTPLTNTPIYYDDQVSSKMALLGKRGFYDPGYIYGFSAERNEKKEKSHSNENNQFPKKFPTYGLNERIEFINNQNKKDNFSQEKYEIEMKNQNELQRNKINDKQYRKENNNLNKEYYIRNSANQNQNIMNLLFFLYELIFYIKTIYRTQ